jgi:hypothetical protein
MRTLALRRQLAQIVLESGARRMILHAWSPAAARWCAPLIDDDHRLVVETPEGKNAARTVIWPPAGRLRHVPRYICPGGGTVEVLVRAGVPRVQCDAPPRTLGWRRPSAERVALLRASLRLSADERVVAVLPPVARASGAFESAWACLLVRQVCPQLRVLVLRGSAEAARIERLLKSVRHEALGCFAPPTLGLGELVALADVAVYVPRASEVAPAIAAARDAGVRVVTTVAGHAGEDVIVCRPRSVRDAARAILQALDQPGIDRGANANRVFAASPNLAEAYGAIYGRIAGDWRGDRVFRAAGTTPAGAREARANGA